MAGKDIKKETKKGNRNLNATLPIHTINLYFHRYINLRILFSLSLISRMSITLNWMLALSSFNFHFHKFFHFSLWFTIHCNLFASTFCCLDVMKNWKGNYCNTYDMVFLFGLTWWFPGSKFGFGSLFYKFPCL